MKLYTRKDLEELAATDPGFAARLDGARLTPSARDFLRSYRAPVEGASSARAEASVDAVSAAPVVPDYEFRWKPGTDPVDPSSINAFYHSAEITVLRRRMCEIGSRMWQRGYTDGNGGNLTIRVGDNLVLCTPTLTCKGFMEPEDMCLVDLEGKQLAGRLKRTSEVMTHLGIMKRQPAAKACCHAHPPHGTAYAVAKVTPPTCLIPEAEVFLGVIGSAPYCTPGTPENADAVGKAAVQHQAVLMENHGVITWGKDIEDAYWKMENTDAYCQTVLIASMLGKPLTPITGKQARELIDIRKQLGMEDYRDKWKECELCDNTEFVPGFAAQVSSSCALPRKAKPDTVLPDPKAEEVVRTLTDRLLKQLQS